MLMERRAKQWPFRMTPLSRNPQHSVTRRSPWSAHSGSRQGSQSVLVFFLLLVLFFCLFSGGRSVAQSKVAVRTSSSKHMHPLSSSE